MKVLLDECLPVELRRHFPDHEVHSVQWAGFKGLKNGRLIKAAQLSGYRVLLTMDQGLPSESSPSGYTLAVIVLRARTNRNARSCPAGAPS